MHHFFMLDKNAFPYPSKKPVTFIWKQFPVVNILTKAVEKNSAKPEVFPLDAE